MYQHSPISKYIYIYVCVCVWEHIVGDTESNLILVHFHSQIDLRNPKGDGLLQSKSSSYVRGNSSSSRYIKTSLTVIFIYIWIISINVIDIFWMINVGVLIRVSSTGFSRTTSTPTSSFCYSSPSTACTRCSSYYRCNGWMVRSNITPIFL